jgi:ubiquitin carboxyl-terminal hydrolase 25
MDDPSLLEEKTQSWVWKEQLRDLEAQKDAILKNESGLVGPDVIAELKEYLADKMDDSDSGVEIEKDDIEKLATDAAKAKEQLESIAAEELKIQQMLSKQFADLKKVPYRLHSVFIHRGTSTLSAYRACSNAYITLRLCLFRSLLDLHLRLCCADLAQVQ